MIGQKGNRHNDDCSGQHRGQQKRPAASGLHDDQRGNACRRMGRTVGIGAAAYEAEALSPRKLKRFPMKQERSSEHLLMDLSGQ